MENIILEKRSIFSKIIDFAHRIMKPKEKEIIVEYSRFQNYLQNISKDSKDYEVVETAAKVCDEALSVAERRISMVNNLKIINDRIKELEVYANLSQEDIAKAKDLLDRFASLSRDRNSLRNQLDGFEHSLSFMRELEEEAPGAIPEIFEAETKQRAFKQDLGYLEGEKEELTYERERFEAGLSFMQKFSVVMCVIFGIVTIFLAFAYISNGTNILLPMTSMVFLVIIISGLLYAFRRRIIFEMDINMRKQKRAVELINKKTVLYAHYTNFLNYEYKKFKIRNSAMLKDNLNEYKRYKYIVGRLDSIRSIMYQTEAEIESFFKEKNIFNSAVTIDKLIETIDLDDKKNSYNQLNAERTLIEKNLSVMDVKHEKLWDLLTDLSSKDTSEEKLIQHIIKSYIDEAGKLINNSIAA